MTTLHLDIETWSPVPITNGTHRYAEEAEIMLFQYALDNESVAIWDVTDLREPMPDDLAALLADETIEITAHNATFERTLFRLGKLRGEVHPLLLQASAQIERWHCTMAQAMSHSLPGALGKLCEILQIDQDQAKNKDGKKLIQLLCKPRPKNTKLRRATRETHPEEWQAFKEYARLDVIAMREVRRKLPTWNYKGRELWLWRLDQKINDRGLCMDVPLAHAAIRATDRAQDSLAAQVQELTDDEVQRATQRDQMLKHILAEYDVDLPDLQASTIERRLADDELPAEVRELLTIRLQASSSSTAKYKRVIQSVSKDGRLRGTLAFCGALRTGRWAGRIFQPHNLPSRGLLPHAEIDFGIQCMLADCEDLVFGNVMHLASSAVRGLIIAPPGKKLEVADLANIEGRDQAWIAGEKWKLQAFRDYDAGEGPDLYVMAYATAFRVSPEAVIDNKKNGDGMWRQIGKVMELMLGYEGGVGAYLTGALTYGFDVEQLAVTAWPHLPRDLREEAEEFLAWTKQQKRPRFGLSDRAFITCDTLKRGWRKAHPNIARFWKLLAEAVRSAVWSPGTTIVVGPLKVRRDGSWLRIGLPSGRALCYPGIALDPKDDFTITYMGVCQYTRRWKRQKTYGGKLFENVCQAVARDVMAHNMPTIEDAGYALVTTVHDEVVTEAPDSPEFNPEGLSRMLAANPLWATDMPLAAAGFETYRYRKD